jgi:type I restriction enzyme S subunit
MTFWNGEEPWISGKDLKTHYLRSSIDKLSLEGFQAAKIAPKGSSLILVRGMTLLKDFPVGYAMRDLAFNQDIKALVPCNNLDGLFLSFLLSGHKHFIRQLVSTAGHGTGRLDTESIKEYPVNIPPLPEQRKIALILSTWYKAISTTERLIDNSKQQKKSLMQQLLTGKKRLLDDSRERFEGEWEEVKLGDISYITTGSSNREDSSLDGEYTFFDRSEDIRGSSRYLFDGAAVIVAGEGQDFVPKHFIGKFDLHQRTYAIMDFKDAHSKFIYYNIGYFRHYFLAQAVGSTVKSLRLPMFQKMPIKLPPIEEQQKIAAVLINADKEINLLEQQLADLKQEKKALMQQLLTGKRRVKLDEKEVA